MNKTIITHIIDHIHILLNVVFNQKFRRFRKIERVSLAKRPCKSRKITR